MHVRILFLAGWGVRERMWHWRKGHSDGVSSVEECLYQYNNCINAFYGCIIEPVHHPRSESRCVVTMRWYDSVRPCRLLTTKHKHT